MFLTTYPQSLTLIVLMILTFVSQLNWVTASNLPGRVANKAMQTIAARHCLGQIKQYAQLGFGVGWTFGAPGVCTYYAIKDGVNPSPDSMVRFGMHK